MSLVQFQSMPQKKEREAIIIASFFRLYVVTAFLAVNKYTYKLYCMILPIQIRFNDVDQMGHINNAVIMEYFDLGKSEYFSAVGVPPETGEFTVVIVHLEVDFLSQIRFHDHIHITTHTEKIGNRSVSVIQQVVNTDTGDICATCHTILSGYSRLTQTSAPIPDSLRKSIKHFEEEHKD